MFICVLSCQRPVLLQFGLSELLLHPLQQLWIQQHVQGRHGQSLRRPQGEELSSVIACTKVTNTLSSHTVSKPDTKNGLNIKCLVESLCVVPYQQQQCIPLCGSKH